MCKVFFPLRVNTRTSGMPRVCPGKVEGVSQFMERMGVGEIANCAFGTV